MAKTVTCDILGQTYLYQGYEYTATRQDYVGNSGSRYYGYVLKLRTGKISGKSEFIRLLLNLATISTKTFDLRWALCTSDENYSAYMNTGAEVSDGNQIASGVLSLSSQAAGTMEQRPLEISTAELQSETEYYLFLWAYGTSYCLGLADVATAHSAVVQYKSRGGAWIGGLPYAAVIQTNAGFARYVPVIWVGSRWARATTDTDTGGSDTSDPTVAKLGQGRMGKMILGKET